MVRSALRAGPAVIALVLFLSAAQLLVQYRAQVDDAGPLTPLTYIEQVLGPRHDAVLDHTVGDPWRFRLLSDWGAEAFRAGARTLGFSKPAAIGFLAFRFVQNVAIFALAFVLYRRLGVPRMAAILGLGLLAWSMSDSLFHVQMSFNTYTDIALYLAAALLILDRRYAWIVPLSIVAALNRETGGLIPVMLIAVGLAPGYRGTADGRRAVITGAVALAAFAATYALIRLAVGPSYYILGNGHHPGFDMLEYNLGRTITYDFVFQTVNILPLLALLAWRRFTVELKAFAVAIVPAWVVIHLFTSVISETRLLLVPIAVVLLPGALLAVAEPVAVRGFRHGP